MKPTIGRIVHFHIASTRKGELSIKPAAAIVTEVHPDGTLNLKVFTALGSQHEPVFVRYAGDDPAPGTWSWPPRDPAEKPATERADVWRARGQALYDSLAELMAIESLKDMDDVEAGIPLVDAPESTKAEGFKAIGALRDWNKEVAS